MREKLLTRRVVVSDEASELIGKLVKIRRISAEQVRVSDLLDETKKALDEVTVESQAGLSRSIDVIARGKVPDGPIEDKRKPIALGAAMFSSIGVLGLIVLASIFYPRIRFSDDLGPDIGNKILAVIPGRPAGRTDLQPVGFKVRNEIDMRSAGEGGTRVIGVAGTTQSGRPDRMVASLANAFAARDVNVLIIDADSDAAVSRAFEVHDKPGLSDVMAADVSLPEAVSRRRGDHGEISVLAAGVTRGDGLRSPISTMTMKEYRALIKTAARHHEVIILALGVLSAGKQSALGASVSDQFLLMMSAGDRKREVTNAVTLLDRVAPERYYLAMNEASPLDPMLERDNPRQERFSRISNRFSFFHE